MIFVPGISADTIPCHKRSLRRHSEWYGQRPTTETGMSRTKRCTGWSPTNQGARLLRPPTPVLQLRALRQKHAIRAERRYTPLVWVSCFRAGATVRAKEVSPTSRPAQLVFYRQVWRDAQRRPTTRQYRFHHNHPPHNTRSPSSAFANTSTSGACGAARQQPTKSPGTTKRQANTGRRQVYDAMRAGRSAESPCRACKATQGGAHCAKRCGPVGALAQPNRDFEQSATASPEKRRARRRAIAL